MPTYEYECSKGHRFEAEQSILGEGAAGSRLPPPLTAAIEISPGSNTFEVVVTTARVRVPSNSRILPGQAC